MAKRIKVGIGYEEFMKEFLADPEQAKSYLELSIDEYLQDKNLKAFMNSLKVLADATGGISKLAKKTGLGRESLYKTLSGEVDPHFSSVMNIIGSLGIKLKAEYNGHPLH